MSWPRLVSRESRRGGRGWREEGGWRFEVRGGTYYMSNKFRLFPQGSESTASELTAENTAQATESESTSEIKLAHTWNTVLFLVSVRKFAGSV